MGKKWKKWHLIFLGSQFTADGDCGHEVKRPLLLGSKAMTNLDNVLKSRDITFPRSIHIVKAMVFPVFMYRCESWTIKKAEQKRIDAFKLWCWRRLLQVAWTTSRSNQSVLKDKSWIFIERTDAEAETPILWPPDVKGRLIGKDPDAEGWGQKEKGETKDEIVGWHHWLNGHEFEQTQGDSGGQGSLVCCSSWGHKESEIT